MSAKFFMQNPNFVPDYNCAGCGHKFNQLHDTRSNPKPPAYDDILLCSACGMVNVVRLLGLEMISDADFEKLDSHSRQELDFARRAIQSRLHQ